MFRKKGKKTEEVIEAEPVLAEGATIIGKEATGEPKLTLQEQWVNYPHGPLGAFKPAEVRFVDDMPLFLSLVKYLYVKCNAGDITPNDDIWGAVQCLHMKYVK